MKIHEYQAKQILKEYGVPVPEGRVAATPEEAASIAADIGCPVVLKAQVHVGGRGKAGGVRLVHSVDEARDVASQILSMEIKGLPVRKVDVNRAVDIEKEFYIGLTLDREARRAAVLPQPAQNPSVRSIGFRRIAPDRCLRRSGRH